jgi:hypothetical protein
MQGWNRASSRLCQTRAKSGSLLSCFSFIQYGSTTCFNLTGYIQIIILILASPLIKQGLQTSSYSKAQFIIPMITINPSCPVIIYVMTATNKQLLISESRSNSNRCTPCRGNPTNTTRMLPTPVYMRPAYASCGQSPYVATFHTVVDRFERVHCTWEEGLPTQSTARRLTDPQVRTQLLSHNSQWSSEEKSSFCRWPTTRLTGPISPACDRYVQ